MGSRHEGAGVERPAVTSVDFHFDVMCPYAYQTSLWIREVRARTGLTVNWRFVSLEEVNRLEGKRHPWEREWSYGWSMMRIGALLRRTDMDDLDRWYATAGRALHVDGHKPHEPAVARALLEELGLDPALVDRAIADPTTGEAAVRLWDAVVAWGEFPQLFELQRPKTPADEAHIVETFRPYLEARDWVSIDRGEVITFPRGAG